MHKIHCFTGLHFRTIAVPVTSIKWKEIITKNKKSNKSKIRYTPESHNNSFYQDEFFDNMFDLKEKQENQETRS